MGLSRVVIVRSAAPTVARNINQRLRRAQFTRNDIVRLSHKNISSPFSPVGTASTEQLMTKIAAGRQQNGQEALFQFVARHPSDVGADVQCCQHLP